MQAHDAAKVALLKARQACQAARTSLQQPCLLHQPYWCEGAGTDAAALTAWQQAGLALRAVVYLKAAADGTEQESVPPLVSGIDRCLLLAGPVVKVQSANIVKRTTGPAMPPLKIEDHS